MNAITAVFYRDYRQRITNAAFLLWDLMVPLAYLLLFGLGFDRLLGGAIAAQFQLGLPVSQFLLGLPAAVPGVNLALGVGKGVVFGMLIALVACHFGLRIEPNTESLGVGTTRSVVASITIVIIADAAFAIAFSDVGMEL